MPYSNPEKKKEWMRNKREEERIVKERAGALEKIYEYRERDERGEFFSGEFLTCEQLWLVFNGIDPKADPNKKIQAPVINPSFFKHEKFDKKLLTFDRWLELRRYYRADLWALMHLVGRGRWSEKAHKPLADFFVKKDNSVLPKDYTESQLSAVINGQHKIHNRLLLYPRGNRKSTINIIDVVQWILNFPDIVVLVCTSTKDLGRDFVENIRTFFTYESADKPAPLQALFPDYCIPRDKGKKSGTVKEYRCPLRHLNRPNPTVFFTSMEVGSAGKRADVIKFDDAVDEDNCLKVDSREKVYRKYLAVTQLLVGRNGYRELIGTRYTDGDEKDSDEGAVPDLYGHILNKSDLDQWKILKASSWTPLPHVIKNLEDLEASDVDLLFPNLPCYCGKKDNPEGAENCSVCGEPLEQSPGNFLALKSKLKEDKRSFLCQQQNEPAFIIKKDDDYINTFTEDNIRAAIEDVSLVPKQFIDKCLFVDTALTAGRRSDWSAFAVVGIEDRGLKKHPLVHYLEIRFVKAADLTLAQHVADLMAKYDCRTWIENLEQFNNPNSSHANFKDEVRRQLSIRGVNHQVTWFTPENKLGAKEVRIRNLQRMHERGLLRFVMGTGNWLDEMMHQLLNYNGDKKLHSNSRTSRKDDIPDVMSQVYHILPYDPETETEDQAEERERQNERNQARRLQEMIWGTAAMSRPLNPDAQVEETRPITPIHDALSVLNHRSGPTVSFSRPKKE